MKTIEFTSIVDASLGDLWSAWTTTEGVRRFLARDCRVDLNLGGCYELDFLGAKEDGVSGTSGTSILSFLPERMLSFEWNYYPLVPELAACKTWVVVEFHALDDELCELNVVHLGWGDGPLWEVAYQDTSGFWAGLLERMEKSIRMGDVDWDTVS